MMDAPALTPATPRFHARRECILDEGSALINQHGLKGLSLGAVAERIGLGGSSVTYYFKRKELLAAACYDRTLDGLATQVAEAGMVPGTRGRIARLLTLVAQGEDRRLARLHEMRAMADPFRASLIGRYYCIFRSARAFFTAAPGVEERLVQVMRTQILLEVAHTLPILLPRYAREEHGRVVDRLVELLVDGLAPPGTAPVVAAPTPPAVAEQGRDRFLDAATRLMNERGYRGASVERIAGSLKVTKGSFYHHLDAKDDLALACYRHSLDTIGRAQEAALAGSGRFLDRIAAALGSLGAIQLGEGMPLLRSTALAALPPEFRQEALDRAERATRRFAGMVADGIRDGSVVAVDPLVAGQYLMSALNTAMELRALSRGVAPARAVALYGAILLSGLG
jgi:AcrR family transcriptional regulator